MIRGASMVPAPATASCLSASRLEIVMAAHVN
jgi:hypothetical protein